MSVISITKRNLTLEIQKIDQKAEYITKLKDEAIQALLEQKDSILGGPCKTTSELPGKIDSRIEHLREQHSAIMTKYSEKQIGMHEEKDVYDHLEEDFDEIDMELRVIQERHDTVMEQLESKRTFLVERLDSIQNMEHDVDDLEAALLTVKSDLGAEMSVLEKQKTDLLKEMSGSEAALKLEQIECDMQEVLHRHETEIDNINEQISNINSLEHLQEKCRRVSEDIDRLEEAKCIAASSAERLQIDSRLKVLMMQQEECDKLLKLAGMSSKERFIKMLEERELFYTPSGQIQTMSGRLLTMAEALAMGLLEDMGDEILDLFGITITKSGQIKTASGELLSPSEAGRLGIFKEAGDISESTVSSASSDTTVSGMSSSDVHYLKTNLGKPLALALAEITAKQPRDPIHYLGHWLFKYRYNQETNLTQKMELEALINERQRLAQQALRQEAEDEAKLTLIDLLGRVEIEAARQEIENELRRIQEEAAAREAENEALEIEAMDTLGVYGGPTAGQKL